MAFWTKETYIDPANSGIVIPFDENKIDCAAYTLRMGAEYYVTPDSNDIDLSKHTKVRLEPSQPFQIPPGQFAFLLTEEYLHIPKHIIAFISIKTGIKWRGLVNVSGFHVDGGFEGYFIFAVYNAGPRAIHLQRGQDLFLLWLAALDNPKTESYRKGKPPQTEISPQLVTDVAGPILSAQSMAAKLTKMESTVDRVKTKIEVYALYGALIGLLTSFIPVGLFFSISHWTQIKAFLSSISSP